MCLSEEVIDQKSQVLSWTRVASLLAVRVNERVDACRHRVIRQVTVIFILEHTVDAEDTS